MGNCVSYRETDTNQVKAVGILTPKSLFHPLDPTFLDKRIHYSVSRNFFIGNPRKFLLSLFLIPVLCMAEMYFVYKNPLDSLGFICIFSYIGLEFKVQIFSWNSSFSLVFRNPLKFSRNFNLLLFWSFIFLFVNLRTVVCSTCRKINQNSQDQINF